MKKYNILIILENFYANYSGKLRTPVYTPRMINTKNATYSRIIPYFDDLTFNLYFGETTPYIANDKNKKFPIDYSWVKKTLDYKDWFAVISCCKKSDDALEKLGVVSFASLPHPASFKWRKSLIEDCVKKLYEKIDKETKTI